MPRKQCRAVQPVARATRWIDHLPVFLRIGKRKEWRHVGKKGQRPFRYEHMWERADSLKPTVEGWWKESGTAGDLQELVANINNMQNVLKGGADRDFGSVLKKTAEIRGRLSILWNSPNSAAQQEEIK